MVDELTQESFQTGKAIVTVSVDLITAIADACKRSEQQNPGMSEEQKETLLGKVVDKVMSNYKETHERQAVSGKWLVRRRSRQGQQGKELCGVPGRKDGYKLERQAKDCR